MKRLIPLLILSSGLLAACGGSRTLELTPISPSFVDESSLSPALSNGGFPRIMVVPPSGTAGVEFQESLAAIERSFIARGITVISSAITSRVILDDQIRDNRRAESGISLSEVERALLLAKESNADAVLQIGTWAWQGADESRFGYRYYVLPKGMAFFNEVDQSEWEQAPIAELMRYRFGGGVLGFTGRLIKVENGEVVASFKIDVPKVNLSDVLVATFDGDGKILTQSYSWSTDERKSNLASERAVGTLFDRLAQIISGGAG